jgi:hypothetical protein
VGDEVSCSYSEIRFQEFFVDPHWHVAGYCSQVLELRFVIEGVIEDLVFLDYLFSVLPLHLSVRHRSVGTKGYDDFDILRFRSCSPEES